MGSCEVQRKSSTIPSTLASLNMLQINSRIIIDTYAWNRFQPNNSVSVSQFAREPLSSNTYDDHNEDIVDACDEDEEYESDYDEEESQDVPPVHETEVADTGKKQAAKPLTKDQLLLCTTILKGYSLKEKKWRKYTCTFHDIAK